MFNRKVFCLLLLLLTVLSLVACQGTAPARNTPAEDTATETEESSEEAVDSEEADQSSEDGAETAETASTAQADLAAVKAYAMEHAVAMKAATEAFRQSAETYYGRIAHVAENHPDEDPYEHLAQEHPDEVAELLTAAKEQWLEASTHYELDEGIIAGVPSLAFFDVWIDAGASAADDPEEALAWQLVLPNGETLDSPGNFFHNLTEPALYGTHEGFVGLKTDLDGDGEVALGEVMPKADVLLASAQGLDEATGQMLTAVEAWEPTLEDTFGALVTMTPTMNEYFEQWKLSSFVTGEEADEESFVALSRLFDVKGILNGLDVAYQNVSPVVAEADADLDAQIQAGYTDLVAYVDDLYSQEQDGKQFSPEEADLFGTEAQDKATALAGQVSQAAALIEVELNEADPVIPDGPIVIEAVVPEGEMADHHEEAESEAEAAAEGGSVTIYSGRGESLVGPLIEQFEADTGINVEVRYGKTAEMAATILEEGENSPADVYYGQDAGALGALSSAGRLVELPDDVLDMVEARFKSVDGTWIGTSGRARVVVYNTDTLTEDDLPDDIFGFCDESWKGRLGWAPTNGSFQAFVTALRVVEGEEKASEWLECIQANEPGVYPKNTPIVEAVGNGEIDAGFVNHYYLFRFLSEAPDFPARNYHPRSGDAGSMINVAGAGILNTAANPEAAETFIRYMLSEEGQTYFNTETNEYPLSADITINELLVPLSDISTPDVDLSKLEDLDGTLQLLQDLGIL